MESIEQIRKIAYGLLIVQSPSGQSERWLWDRTCRVVRHIQAISRMPELQEMQNSIDLPALELAGYLSDSGLPIYAQAKELPFPAALLELGRPEIRDFSIQIIHEKLADLSDSKLTDSACRIIAESDNRFTQMIEARILSDARNLEDMGTIGIIQDIRRCLLQGKGITAILEGWKRKIDYRYWEARLKESFHFESVRRIAQQRFVSAENCMRALETEESGLDFKNLVLESHS